MRLIIGLRAPIAGFSHFATEVCTFTAENISHGKTQREYQ